MKRFFPFALGGVVFLLTSCSSNAPTVSTTSTSTTTTTKVETKSEKAGSDTSETAKSEDSSEDKTASSEDGESSNSARGLYVEQSSKQDSNINTGIVYWLELNRDGKKSKVTNKTLFQDGDQVRIHVKPNVTCYGYVLELKGSQGDRAVLFPSDDLPENKLKANKEVILPMAKKGDEAWIKFDPNPGTEVMRIVVSRKKIDPETELPDGETSSVKIASARGTDEDVPDGALATVVDDDVKPSRNLTVVTKSKHPDEEGQTTVVSKSKDKALRVDIAMEHGEATNN